MISENSIIRAAARYHMFEPGNKILVAVSGGPDSVAMLHALHTHSAEFGISLHVAHLNHGIRGEQSNIDEEFVRNLAQHYGLDATTEKVDVPSLQQELKVGIEEAAREIRYKFLRETAANIGADKIAVGHNADDRAESVLLNVIRGTGIDGLGSIQPIRGNIVRPLIETWRYEIEDYIRENNLQFRIDESNTDTTYSRNRVRYELIPLLQRDYNPQVKQALLRLAEIASLQSDLIHGLTDRAREQVTYRNVLDAGLFLSLPKSLQYELIRVEILGLKGDLKDVTFEQVNRVIQELNTGNNFTITLPSGRIYAERRGNAFLIRPEEELPDINPFEYVLQLPGITQIPETGIALDCSIIDNPQPQKLPLDETFIDIDVIRGKLYARNTRPGDRIIPFGMHREKKLQDVFVDKKVPRKQRAEAVVISDDEKILWVVGVIASESVRVTNDTNKAVHISARPEL